MSHTRWIAELDRFFEEHPPKGASRGSNRLGLPQRPKPRGPATSYCIVFEADLIFPLEEFKAHLIDRLESTWNIDHAIFIIYNASGQAQMFDSSNENSMSDAINGIPSTISNGQSIDDLLSDVEADHFVLLYINNYPDCAKDFFRIRLI